MKRRLRYALQLLSLVLFGLILWWGGSDAWEQLLNGDLRFILAALLLRGLAGMIATTRLQLVSRALAPHRPFSWRRFYHLTMTARALGLVVPRSLSTIGGKAVALRTFGISLRRSVWLVMVDNLFDVMLLGTLALPAVLFLQGSIGGVALGISAVAMVLLVVAVVWWATRADRMAPLLAWLGRFPRLARWLRLDSVPAGTLFPSPGRALTALAWTLLLNLILATSFYAIGHAVGLDAPWLLFAASFPITQLSLIIAVAPGGLGIFDLGWLGLLRLGGTPQDAALTFVVAQRAYLFIFVLIWAAVSTLLSLTVAKQLSPAANPSDPDPASTTQTGKQ